MRLWQAAGREAAAGAAAPPAEGRVQEAAGSRRPGTKTCDATVIVRQFEAFRSVLARLIADRGSFQRGSGGNAEQSSEQERRQRQDELHQRCRYRPDPSVSDANTSADTRRAAEARPKARRVAEQVPPVVPLPRGKAAHALTAVHAPARHGMPPHLRADLGGCSGASPPTWHGQLAASKAELPHLQRPADLFLLVGFALFLVSRTGAPRPGPAEEAVVPFGTGEAAGPRHCLCIVFPLPSVQRHCRCFVFPLPSVAETLPLPCGAAGPRPALLPADEGRGRAGKPRWQELRVADD